MATIWRMGAVAIALASALGCSGSGSPAGPPVVGGAGTTVAPAAIEASLPRRPGAFAPSLVAIEGGGKVDGTELADVDTCDTCHAEVVAQWRSGIHSFASFGNPIYRFNVELARRELGKPQSQHCGGCHDMPLEVDGAMQDEIVADDLRAHTGVSCRVCHGVRATATDGNGSYVLTATALPTPNVDDPASVATHRQAVAVKQLGSELCVTCHRGFLSPDVDVPVHLSGIDEPTAWRSSAYTGSGMARVDKVDQQDCVGCHMPEVAVGPDDYAGDGKVRAHWFAGGHSWMASMRDDAAQLERIQAMLRGAASIDVAGAIVVRDPGGALAPLPSRSSRTPLGDARRPSGPDTVGGRWHLPAEGAPVEPGQRVLLDVVVRNRLVGHRFPGGVNDMQDTWIEVEARDARGALIAASGLRHERDAGDDEAHVLRSYPVDQHGRIQEEHELPRFRAVIANHTLAAREAQAIRYALDVPAAVALPIEVRARLRHRSRGLTAQQAVCAEARTEHGATFLRQAKQIRDMTVDPCKPQPVTEVASTVTWIGAGGVEAATKAGDAARAASGGAPAAAWERSYEHGMALTSVVTERLDEPRQVLEHALALLPETAETARPRAMVLVQLAVVASRQGRADDALALIARARALLPAPQPPALDAVAADALARVWRWQEAAPFARAATEKAPQNTQAWVVLARILGSLRDDAGALAAARQGLALAPRDADLLRSQSAALAALVPGSALAADALAAYDRFRAPDMTAALRIACAAASSRCAREREMGHVHELKPPR